MMTDDMTLPDGVDPDDVEKSDDHPDVLAYDVSQPGPSHRDGKPFNPQNGRWYFDESTGYGVFDFDQLKSAIGYEMDCAYEDCDGHADGQVDVEIPSDGCPDCGAPMMGRGQFSKDSKRRRGRRSSLSSRAGGLSDEFAEEMKELTEAGVTPTQALDYLMCHVAEVSASEWAEARGVSESQIRTILNKVATETGENFEYKK